MPCRVPLGIIHVGAADQGQPVMAMIKTWNEKKIMVWPLNTCFVATITDGDGPAFPEKGLILLWEQAAIPSTVHHHPHIVINMISHVWYKFQPWTYLWFAETLMSNIISWRLGGPNCPKLNPIEHCWDLPPLTCSWGQVPQRTQRICHQAPGARHQRTPPEVHALSCRSQIWSTSGPLGIRFVPATPTDGTGIQEKWRQGRHLGHYNTFLRPVQFLRSGRVHFPVGRTTAIRECSVLDLQPCLCGWSVSKWHTHEPNVSQKNMRARRDQCY